MDQRLNGTARRAPILAHQGEGGTGDRTCHTESSGKTLGEGRLARTQFADQQHDVARPADRSQSSPRAPSGLRTVGGYGEGPCHWAHTFMPLTLSSIAWPAPGRP